MELQCAATFDPERDAHAFLDPIPRRAAVFAVFPEAGPSEPQPYLSRTRDLHRRLARLLAAQQTPSKRLNLRAVARRVEYQCVGSNFEAQWLLYRLNRFYYPRRWRERLRLRPPALLKVNLANRFPRCFPTRRITRDGSLYYGPFASRAAAERYAAEFLDLFKIRRCVEDLEPDPAHPGCIYSQMRMCLAPCFVGCTDDEYGRELGRVISFLDSEGRSLQRALDAERAAASEALEFERASQVHRKMEKLSDVLRLKSGLARNVAALDAIMVQPGAEPKSVTFFRIAASEIRGPVALSLDERVSSPLPLDERLRDLLEPLARHRAATLPPWEHLSLLGRWYYSSFREGELVMLDGAGTLPHARLIRICSKLVRGGA